MFTNANPSYPVRDIPDVHRKFIGEIIEKYRAAKAQDAKKRFIHFTMPASPTMRLLEKFYRTEINMINLSGGKLSAEECFDLVKIIFIKNKKDSKKTKDAIDALLTKFNPAVSAALDQAISRYNNLDMLENYFELMCKNPEDAATIVYAHATLYKTITIAKKYKIYTLYSEKLLEAIMQNTRVATILLEIIQHWRDPVINKNNITIGNSTKTELLMNDAKLYLLVNLHLSNQYDAKLMSALDHLTYDELVQMINDTVFNAKNMRAK